MGGERKEHHLRGQKVEQCPRGESGFPKEREGGLRGWLQIWVSLLVKGRQFQGESRRETPGKWWG